MSKKKVCVILPCYKVKTKFIKFIRKLLIKKLIVQYLLMTFVQKKVLVFKIKN